MSEGIVSNGITSSFDCIFMCHTQMYFTFSLLAVSEVCTFLTLFKYYQKILPLKVGRNFKFSRISP